MKTRSCRSPEVKRFAARRRSVYRSVGGDGRSLRRTLSAGLTKFADIIGEIDPAKPAGGVASAEASPPASTHSPHASRHFCHERTAGVMNSCRSASSISWKSDVQIRGYPVKFDIDVLILFGQPVTYNRSGKVIPQLKDRIGSVAYALLM
jgi:magnesium chelatase subunit I